jgi:hypothetical protein
MFGFDAGCDGVIDGPSPESADTLVLPSPVAEAKERP